jgi:hypothetical protein
MENYPTTAERDSSSEDPIRNAMLRKALDDRERFLNSCPHLRAYQRQIDHLLDRAGNVNGRMAVLATLAQAKMLELRDRLNDLNRILAGPSD